MRSFGSSYVTPARSILRKPPSSPIRAHLLGAGLGEDPPVARGIAARARVGRRGDRLVELALRRDEALPARAVRMVVAGRRGLAGGGRLGLRQLCEHALVVGREDLDELREQRVPLVEHAPPDRRAGAAYVLVDEVAHLDGVALVERLELVEHHRVDAPPQGALLVEYE